MTTQRTLRAALLATAASVLLAPVGAPADFLILDDLIVDGSACIGFDCINGESFGFDTIKLKENNLRIKFDDTSVAASYPRNDWQITINDSANGGASKFSIDDISGNRTPFTIEANARSHSLYVDDGGRIGIRTSTPSVEIHVIDGDTPTLRLQQDGSSGFAPQTWDVAGNETNFFIRDVTNGSQLPFRIRPDAPTNSIFIDVSGDIGAGTSSPAEELHIRRNDGDDVFVQIEAQDAQNAGLVLANSADFFTNFIDTAGDFVISTDGGPAFEFEINGGTGNVTIGADLTVDGTIFGTVSSSRAAKTAIEPVDPTEVLARVAAMPMAEDFHAAFGLGRDDTSISLVDYSGVALAAIQGLDRVVAREVAALRAENAALLERLAALEARLAAE